MRPAHDAVMSIVARPPVADPPRGSRAGDESAIGSSLTLLGALLPTGGTPPAPAPTPRRALALDALHVLRLVRGTVAADAAWADPTFVRCVESVRRELAPIHSRSALAASFAREAFHIRRPVLTPDGSPTGPMSPVRLAYAIRWLELGDGEARPSWDPGLNGKGRGRGGLALPRRRPPGGSRPRR